MGFLRQLFGPSREEVWRRLSDETGAAYVDGGFWGGSKVVIKVKLCHLDSAYEDDPQIHLK